MSSGQTPGAAPPRSKWLLVLIPGAGLVILVVAVAVLLRVLGPEKPDGTDKGPRPRRDKPTDLAVMYDGSRPGAADPDLRDVGGGLKVRDLLEGDGAEVKEEDTVTCDYTGWLLDGTIFDSSWKGGTPATFGLNGVIRGWTKGIPGMKVGGIRKLVIPQELGYGERGSPPTIPPMATLVFEVQVLAIKDDSKEKGGRGKMPPGHP